MTSQETEFVTILALPIFFHFLLATSYVKTSCLPLFACYGRVHFTVHVAELKPNKVSALYQCLQEMYVVHFNDTW